MREVYDNAMVAHLWANQSKPHARTANGNFYYEGKVVYSYGSHFPVAVRLDARTVVFNSDSYSPSTSQHQELVRRASSHIGKRLFVNKRILQTLARSGKLNRHDRDVMVEEAMRTAQSLCQAAAKRRKASLREQDFKCALAVLDESSELIDLFKLRPLKKMFDLRTMIASDRNQLQAHFQVQLEREQKRKEAAARKQLRERAKRLRDAIDVFRSGGDLGYFASVLRGDEHVLLRIRGEEIETSHGAKFPAEHGKKAFPLIQSCRAKARSYRSNGYRIHLGHFAIDNIDERGNVRAGCHLVTWPEVERTAMELGVLEPA